MSAVTLEAPTAAGAASVVRPWTDGAAWDAFVHARPDAEGYHLFAWRGVFEDVFGQQAVYLAAERDGRIVGVLPLVAFASPLFGRCLVSVPFLNYGGVLAADDEAARALVSRAGQLRVELGASHVELRHRARRFAQLVPRTHKVTMLLPLAATEEGLWTSLDRKVRNQVRKAEKSGCTVESGGGELVDAFYAVFAQNMRDLGTPVYARRFFAEMLARFPDRARLTVVRHEGRPVAAGFTVRWRGTVEVPWASSLRAYNTLAPNTLLYWTMLKDAVAAGATTFDFGRSTPGEGTFHFKQQWGARPQPLCWEYDLGGGTLPDHSPKNPKFRLAIAVWRRLPLAVANALGPHVVRAIP